MAFKTILPQRGSHAPKGARVMIACGMAKGHGGRPYLRIGFSQDLMDIMGWKNKDKIVLEHDPEAGKLRVHKAGPGETGFSIFTPGNGGKPRIVSHVQGIPNERRPSEMVLHRVVGKSVEINLPGWAVAPVQVAPIKRVS